MSMFIRVFGTATHVACLAVSVLAQDALQDQEGPVASSVNLQQRDMRSATAAAAGPTTLVAWCSHPGGIAASTGNLYFTCTSQPDDTDPTPPSASFYRSSKSGTPGSEGSLYRETGARVYSFGKPVWAYTGGTYYGYFAANYSDFGVLSSQIKRVPLGGGSAITIGYPPAFVGNRDLVTDGSRLFWADSSGIRSMSIGGGAVENLVSIHGSARFLIGGWDANYLYYSVGSTISRVPKAGGNATTVTTATKVVTALYFHSGSSPTTYWGEKDGAVRSIGASGIQTHDLPWPGRDVTSVGFDGTRVLWIECTEPSENYCYVNVKSASGTHTVSGGGSSARNLQWDATSMYWMGGGAISRYVH